MQKILTPPNNPPPFPHKRLRNLPIHRIPRKPPDQNRRFGIPRIPKRLDIATQLFIVEILLRGDHIVAHARERKYI